jgi:hypothetical protein
MTDDAFSPGSPETEIDRRNKVLVMPPGRRGMIAYVMLTNDRILFGRQLFVNPGGAGLLDLVVERQIQKQYDKKAGGPSELLTLTDIRSAKKIRRPLRGDLYEFELSDGTTCGLGASAGKHWDADIRRLLSERHRRTVVDEDAGSWRAE